MGCRPKDIVKRKTIYDRRRFIGLVTVLADGPLADYYAKRLEDPASVITPAIVVYEVYKHAKRLRGEDGALDAVAAMRKSRIVPLNEELALIAADVSLDLKFGDGRCDHSCHGSCI